MELIRLSSQYGHSHKNRKYKTNNGFVFSLDAILAIAIAMVILGTAFAIFVGSLMPNTAIFAKRTASDIIAVLDYQNILDSYDRPTIEAALSIMTPKHLLMFINITKYDESMNRLSNIEAGTSLTDNYYTGRWLFVTFNDNTINGYYKVDYKVAFKQ